METTEENLIQYRLTQIENKVKESDKNTLDGFRAIQKTLNEGFGKYITNEHLDDKLKDFVKKEDFQPIAQKATTSIKILVWIGAGIGSVILGSIGYFIISGALAR